MIILLILIIVFVSILFIYRAIQTKKNRLGSEKEVSLDAELNTPKTQVISDKKFIIFLDFQGVLFIEEKDYRFVPNLCQVLDKFPKAGIVISSTYKDLMSFSSIQNIFPEKFRSRILGVTPSIGMPRYVEIEKYVSDNNITNFVAIDDDPDGLLFPEGCKYLFRTNAKIGLNDETLEKFIDFIKLHLDLNTNLN